MDARGGGVLDVFDAFAEQATDPEFRGCAAINAMVEAADRGSVVHQVAADHKEQLTAYLATLAGEDLAGALMLLVDGALVTSLRDRSAMPRARALAARLLPDPTSATPVATQERAEKL